MAVNDYKITDTQDKKVSDVSGNTLSGTVAQNKAVFDQLGLFIIEKYNGLIDYLRTKGIDTGMTASSFDVTSLTVGTMPAHTAAGTTYTYSQTQTKSGYTPLGIVGTTFGNTYFSPNLAVSQCALTTRSSGTATATVKIYSAGNTEAGGISLVVNILWVKN